MPWKELSVMSQRQEFAVLAMAEGANLAELCRRFVVSRKTGYKWVSRYREEGRRGLEDRSRRPRRSPGRTPPSVERLVLQVRQRHPTWGGRKIHARLEQLGHRGCPGPEHDHGDPATVREARPGGVGQAPTLPAVRVRASQ